MSLSPRKRRARGDAEKIARNRVLLASLVIYLVCMGFLAAADGLIGARGGNLIYARLAVLPLFVLMLRFWLRRVRVSPPTDLIQARRLSALGRHQAALEKLAEVDPDSPGAQKLDRARRTLQDGLAVPVADEVDLERGRLNLLIGDCDSASRELSAVYQRQPKRADIAIDLADALARCGRDKEAADALRGAAPWMDAVDQETLQAQPSLMRLLGDTPLPARSAMAPRIWQERALSVLLIAAAVAHGAWFYLS